MTCLNSEFRSSTRAFSVSIIPYIKVLLGKHAMLISYHINSKTPTPTLAISWFCKTKITQ